MRALTHILTLSALSTATRRSELDSQHPIQHHQPIVPESSPDHHLLITAVRHRTSPPHHSYLQCLRLPTPFHTYPTVGSSAFLSATSNATLVVLPPHSAEGWHKPPAPMWFFLLRGRARVQTPSSGDEVWIEPSSSSSPSFSSGSTTTSGDDSTGVASGGGKQQRLERQIVLALDVLGKGHLTFYPDGEETVALQIPLGADWEEWVAGLEIVGEGAC